MHQKLCILFITSCKVYVDTDLCIYSPNCVLLVMSCRLPINIICILADCQNGTHVAQCDLLCVGIDNSSLPYVTLYTYWHRRKLTAHKISRGQKSYIKQQHHLQRGSRDVTLLQTYQTCKM